jgi:hypothetical protein
MICRDGTPWPPQGFDPRNFGKAIFIATRGGHGVHQPAVSCQISKGDHLRSVFTRFLVLR